MQAIKSYETYSNIKFMFPVPNYRKNGENVASLYLCQTR